jgi:hypothetical protein
LKNTPDQDREALLGYLKSLSHHDLDELLNEVLVEIRSRESDELKKDILRHSQKLSMGRRTP